MILGNVAQKGGFRYPGLLTGLAALGYALARIAMEFFREPDPQIEQLPYGLTMGMVLSAPMAVIGIALMLHSARAKRQLQASRRGQTRIEADSADPARPPC
jgi:phosphatidylglycerol:prolipoprotein diacylglycerol transferase